MPKPKPKPKPQADNTDLGFDNSCYHAQPHPIIVHYICKSDVIPTDDSFMHAEVTSPTTLTSILINFVMAESKSRFATLSEEDLNLLLDDKDAKSTKRATKSALKVFHSPVRTRV